MINLANTYGDNLFRRNTVYKNVGYFGIISNIIVSLIFAYFIVRMFDVQWDYAVFKVWFILFLIDSVKGILSWVFNKINYHVNIKQAVESEIRHYLRVFKSPLNEENSGCIEDYLLEAAFDESLDRKMNILAAMNYTSVVCLMSVDPKWDGYYYKGWLKAAEEYANK